jgi:hypothetical protein
MPSDTTAHTEPVPFHAHSSLFGEADTPGALQSMLQTNLHNQFTRRLQFMRRLAIAGGNTTSRLEEIYSTVNRERSEDVVV